MSAAVQPAVLRIVEWDVRVGSRVDEIVRVEFEVCAYVSPDEAEAFMSRLRAIANVAGAPTYITVGQEQNPEA